MRSSFVSVAGIAALCTAQSTFEPLRPPSLPLAVRSPYFSTWQQAGSDAGNGGYLPGQWPTFWFGAITGWTGYIRVDNISYTWMGAPNVTGYDEYFAVQTGYQYTSTQSIFNLNIAGVVGMVVTFTSPVLPDTLLEMSLPYSYMDVEVNSIDGNDHAVQLYTDITAEWVAGDRGATAQWSYGTINEDEPPTSYPPVPTPNPAPSSSTTQQATGTSWPGSYTGIPSHGPSPIYASGQGHRPTGEATPPQAGVRNSTQPKILNQQPGGVAYHRVWRQTQLEFTETNQQAEWGYWYYATSNDQNVTHQSGEDVIVRKQFINNGFLSNTEDTQYRPINDSYPTFGWAVDLGEIGQGTNRSHLFQLSLNQQNCIYFEEAQGNTSVPCLWTNYFDTEEAAVEHFFNDYSNIISGVQALDDKIRADSVAAAGEDYYSLTALSVVQAFGGLEYVNSPTQPWIFLKEISSDGDIQTVDVIFPFHPILVYLNATLLRYILDPLFINQEAGYFPYTFAEHDLGPFPNATGYNNLQVGVENQPVEECGNMLIMTLAYAQRTGDDAYLTQHYGLLKQWNEYLVNDSLIPGDQLSTDDFLGQVQNDTNLALKGIIGIEAMAQIANRTGHAEDGANFTAIAHSYIDQWQSLGVNFNSVPPHSETQYGNTTTWDILYNLYGDAELGLQLVPEKIYTIQSDFYPTVFQKYGVPLRSNLNETKADWELFAAAIASESTKNQFISIIATWLNQTSTNFAFTDFYDAVTGGYGQNMFINRPVVGAMFSLLALESAPTSGYVTPASS